MLKFIFAFFIFYLLIPGHILAQDSLPSISVKTKNNKVIISWKNAYGAQVNNINIQRSTDSLKKFSTIGSVLNPMNRENGYVDSKVPDGKIFYRVFIAFEGGNYVFSHSYSPVLDTSVDLVFPIFVEEKKEKEITRPVTNIFVPSKFVFTGKDNNVIINLHDAATRKFSIKFFDEYDKPLFEIHNIREPYLILEKVNFLHAGWFKYHLYDNDILLEKYKFYIPKDGKSPINSRSQF
jgi:hypothetical protein